VGGRNGTDRATVSVLSVFKNPIILLSLVSMGLFFGLPKLVENSKSLAFAFFFIHEVGKEADTAQWTPRCAPSGRSARRRTL
jgi:hypothetical protein